MNRLLDNLYTAVLVFDHRLRLKDVNTAGENLLFVSLGKIVGRPAGELLPCAGKLAENLERTLASRQPRMEWDIELPLPDARSVRVHYILTPVMEEDACKEVIVELINADSYDRVIREANLSVLHDAARRSLSGMAHEIKNPLGGLRAAAQLLQRELQDTGLIEYTRIIISEADRLCSLIDRMLAPAAGKRRRVNIHEALEYTCNLVEAEAEPGVTIRRDYDPSLPPLQADREQLIQALLNICRNAVQALDGAGEMVVRTRIERHCTIRQQRHRLVVRIDIIDNGPGAPAELESHIFYPLVTGRADGTGLGLSISQSLIQSHNGMIRYERLDNRTYFRIFLPVADEGRSDEQ